MTKNLFVKTLKDLQPSPDALEGFGLSETYVKRYLTSYLCPPKNNNPLHTFMNNNELLSLLQHFDCSNISISILSFYLDIKELPNYYLEGDVEQDFLAINKTTLEVEVLDIHDPETVIWYCAANSSLFLDALIKCAEYYSKRIQNRKLATDNIFRNECILTASKKAGGNKYEEFYKTILGFYS